MIIKGKDVNRSVLETPDACVIGSGAAGAIICWQLAEKGHTVVLLEKGGYHQRETHTQKEDEMISLLYKNSGLQFTIPTGIAVAQGSCVGGSTVVNDAVCFRTPPAVLGWWHDDYKIEDIEPEHMKKYFETVERRISVSEVQPYEINKNNDVMRKGCKKLGWEAGPNSRNCKNCKQCGLCHLGCYYGTKQSMLETYIKDVDEIHGNSVKIYADCRAERIETSGGRATGVKAVANGENSEEFDVNVKPKIVIVSGGTIASSELLLKSGLNRNGKVGVNITLHPSPAIIGDFEEEINGHQGIPMAYHSSEFSVQKTGKRGYLLESVFLAPYQFSLPLPGFQYDHKELMKRYNHYALIGTLLHDEPVGSIALGGPLGTILSYQLSQGDAKMMTEGMKSAAKILFAAGAQRVITSHRKRTVLYSEDDMHLIDERGVGPTDISIGSGHPQGGNQMGGTPESSVVDSYSKFHGLQNLFVCDASVFPTAVGVNPQLTVMALATRVAEHIADNWNQGKRYAG
ncbi:MAG: GMC family oxidoreductase [Thaumarchaeota archaeon]|nr:GMC family oxidoreductase [Nitrososphaerota archaeon]